MAGWALEDRVCNQQADKPYFLVLVSTTDSDSISISPSFSACWQICAVKRVICCCCCLCCRPKLPWNLFSMFVGTAMLWPKCSHNLCVLLQVGIVSTRVGNARMNTPKLNMASTSHLFLVSAWVFKPTKMGREVFLSLSCLWSDDCFGDFVFWKAIDCEFNSAALSYNCLASDCYVTYGPVSTKRINVFFSVSN